MKRLIALSVAICSIGFAFSQSNSLIDKYENISGKNYLTDSIITENEFVFANKINQSCIDSASNTLTIQLINQSKNSKSLNYTGNILQFDLNDDVIKWDKPINYQQSNFKQFGNLIIENTATQSNILNFDNGKVQFETQNTLYHVDPKLKIGIGYKLNSSDKNTVEAINLNTGEVCWKRKISHDFGWNDITYLNDSVILLISDGLHTINIKNGKGWDYEAVTGRNNYSSTIATNIVGFGLGLLTGTFVATAEHDEVCDLVSNTLIDGENIFFASKDKISCLNMDGSTKWENSSDRRSRSNSIIFIKDSVLYLLNKGTAFMEDRKINYGKPFLAAYNKNNGNYLFNTTLKNQEFDFVDFSTRKDTIILLSEKNASNYSLKTGKRIDFRFYDVEKTGKFTGFVGSQIYIKTDSTFHSLTLNDTTLNYITTDKNIALGLDSHLDVVKQLSFDDFYICYFANNNFKFLANGDETIVIDNDNKVIANFRASSNAFVIGDQLFEILEKSVIQIDLTDLFAQTGK